MAGARALWRATGVKEEDLVNLIIAVVNLPPVRSGSRT